MNRTDDPQQAISQDTNHPPRSLAEWVSFGIASTILLSVLGLIIYAWVSKDDRPPVLSIDRVEPIRETEGKFYVPFEISNTGGETAESVQIVAELEVNGKVRESGDFSIDFLSQNEKEEGAFIFNHDPRQGKMTLRVSSYKTP